jgi:hypothetical protein
MGIIRDRRTDKQAGLMSACAFQAARLLLRRIYFQTQQK